MNPGFGRDVFPPLVHGLGAGVSVLVNNRAARRVDDVSCRLHLVEASCVEKTLGVLVQRHHRASKGFLGPYKATRTHVCMPPMTPFHASNF